MDHPERIESWRPFPDWEGWYDISDKGRFRSLDRLVTTKDGRQWSQAGRVLGGWVDDDGYRHYSLSRGGRTADVYAHIAVLCAFDRPPLPGEVCRHGPRGPGFNWWPEDIRWGTYAENEADKLRDGTFNHDGSNRRGERHGLAELTEAIVRDCRARRAAGETYVTLAAEYGVNKSTIRAAVLGITWGWLS